MSTLPITLQYFNVNGIHASARATFVSQRVRWLNDSVREGRANEDDFWLFDFGLGYRLPRRMGVFSFEVRNLLDRSFLYQDLNVQTVKPIAAPFLPERVVLGRVVVNF
jgi:hypothetical protein